MYIFYRKLTNIITQPLWKNRVSKYYKAGFPNIIKLFRWWLAFFVNFHEQWTLNMFVYIVHYQELNTNEHEHWTMPLYKWTWTMTLYKWTITWTMTLYKCTWTMTLYTMYNHYNEQFTLYSVHYHEQCTVGWSMEFFLNRTIE